MTNTVPMRETPDHASARVITLDEAAEMLCCSYSTVLRLVTDGELRERGIIVAVARRNARGYLHLGRSNFGHVAQYCFTREAWRAICCE